MRENSRQILLSPFFLFGLFLLLLNDFVLKSEFHNFFTGKLSDFAGLFVFPLFWWAFFPARKLFIFATTAAFFVFWKSPYADGFIDLWNGLGIFGIERTINYTDLIALSVLLPGWFYSKKSAEFKLFALPTLSQKFALTVVAFGSLFAFTATSQTTQMQMEEFSQAYKFQTSSLEILTRLQGFETSSFQQSKYDESKPAEFNIALHEKVCDGFPEAAFSVSSGDKAEIKLNRILYPCDKPLPDQREKLQRMFESEIIAFLNNK